MNRNEPNFATVLSSMPMRNSSEQQRRNSEWNEHLSSLLFSVFCFCFFLFFICSFLFWLATTGLTNAYSKPVKQTNRLNRTISLINWRIGEWRNLNSWMNGPHLFGPRKKKRTGIPCWTTKAGNIRSYLSCFWRINCWWFDFSDTGACDSLSTRIKLHATDDIHSWAPSMELIQLVIQQQNKRSLSLSVSRITKMVSFFSHIRW